MTISSINIVVDSLLGEIASRARRGRVALPSFGVFYVGTTASREIVDRQSKKRCRLPARWAMRFRAAGIHKGSLEDDSLPRAKTAEEAEKRGVS